MSACPDYAVQSLGPSSPIVPWDPTGCLHVRDVPRSIPSHIVPWYTWDVYTHSHYCGTHGGIAVQSHCPSRPIVRWYTCDPTGCLHVCASISSHSSMVHMGSHGMSTCPDYAVQSLCLSRPIVPWYTWNPMGCLHVPWWTTAHCGTHGIPWDVCMSRLCRVVQIMSS